MIYSYISILDFSNLYGIFVPIFSHCNLIPDYLGVLTYLASLIFLIFAVLGFSGLAL
jgi:hypothetical protein